MNQFTHANTTPWQNIAEIVSEGNAFSTLAAGLKEAGLIDMLAGSGPFTVFLPSDEAFKKLPHGAIDALMKDKAKLKTVLSYHVVAGHWLAKNLKPGNLKCMEGSALQIKISGASIEVNEARVLGADVMATNGVVHIVDAVLLPKNVKLISEAA
jgi:uncharacterized surface protein with fasciclin (FAS1) repeats